MDDDAEVLLIATRHKSKPAVRKPKKIVYPRRKPSVKVPEKPAIIPEKPPQPKILTRCQKSPLSLYELACEVVDRLPLPPALGWSEEDVASWMDKIGLPQYCDCMLANHINGMRLLMFEDPSHFPMIIIHNHDHMKIIMDKIRDIYSLEFVKFARSIGLPPRHPLTHCTWFKSRTGPSWGIRQNWTRSDILRWMKIIGPKRVYRDHWESVWYEEPEFPKAKFARITTSRKPASIPVYKAPEPEICREYLEPRKFRFQTGIPDDKQLIWNEWPLQPVQLAPKKSVKMAKTVPKDTKLHPKRVKVIGLSGKELLLARRKMNKPKFLPKIY